jgi:hypothetical protein
MRNKIYEKSLIATATITNKSENQDCKGEFLSNDFNALFIADGLGSYKYAKQSSRKNHRYKFFKSLQASKTKINRLCQSINKRRRKARREFIWYYTYFGFRNRR